MSPQVTVFLLLAAAADIAGAIFFLLRRKWESEALRVLIATGAGFMLAVAIVEMLPESLALVPTAPIWVIAGFFVVHLSEHVLTPHFHYGHETHPGLGAHARIAATLGLMVHSLIDGIAIVVAMQADTRLGALVFLAMVWHKVPSGFTIASIINATGGSRRGSLLAASALGVASIVGGVGYLVIQGDGWIGPALGLSSGSLIYVAATDLLPEVNKRRTVLAPLAVLFGAAAYYLVHLLSGY